MSVLPAALGAVVLFVMLAVAGDLLSEEIRGRLDRVPRLLIRLAGRRLDKPAQTDYIDEWSAELQTILHERGAESLPLTRLIIGARYAASLLVHVRSFKAELNGVTMFSWQRHMMKIAFVIGASWLAIGSSVPLSLLIFGSKALSGHGSRGEGAILVSIVCCAVAAALVGASVHINSRFCALTGLASFAVPVQLLSIDGCPVTVATAVGAPAVLIASVSLLWLSQRRSQVGKE